MAETHAMLSLVAHAVLGLVVLAVIVRSNPAIFRKVPAGAPLSALEIAYYAIGVASIALGWYFNIRFVRDYGSDSGNPVWGPGSWADYIRLMFTNPAASSAAQDYTIGNVVVLPLFTIIDGRRRGIRSPWLFFVSSLFTSFVFGWVFYLATAERQRRIMAAETPEIAVRSQQ